jgi:hypothetical protein
MFVATFSFLQLFLSQESLPPILVFLVFHLLGQSSDALGQRLLLFGGVQDLLLQLLQLSLECSS